MNHIVPDTTIKPLGTDIMLMGIGVTHPSPGSKYGAPSISSVVASIDDHLSQWPGSIRTQTGRVEMVGKLMDMVLAETAPEPSSIKSCSLSRRDF